jgi:hypothetical protein
VTAKFKVGDTVIHVGLSYGRGRGAITECVIRKVGRKYAYLEGPWYAKEIPFSLEDGIEHRRDGYNNNLERIWVPAEWEAKKRREKALADLKDAGIMFKGYGEPPYDTQTLERLLAVALDSKRIVAVL